MADFTSHARKLAYTAVRRLSAVASFLLDQAGNILTTQADEPLLTQKGYTGTPISSIARREFYSVARETAFTSVARKSWVAKERI